MTNRLYRRDRIVNDADNSEEILLKDDKTIYLALGT